MIKEFFKNSYNLYGFLIAFIPAIITGLGMSLNGVDTPTTWGVSTAVGAAFGFIYSALASSDEGEPSAAGFVIGAALAGILSLLLAIII